MTMNLCRTIDPTDPVPDTASCHMNRAGQRINHMCVMIEIKIMKYNTLSCMLVVKLAKFGKSL